MLKKPKSAMQLLANAIAQMRSAAAQLRRLLSELVTAAVTAVLLLEAIHRITAIW